jgi:ankyrin repeat protein
MPMSKRHLSMLDRLTVKSPCSEDWDAMSGNEQARFCSHCASSVHNLSELTRAEAMALVRKSQGRLCVRYYRRPDGAIQTTTENLRSLKRRASRLAAGAFTATLSLCASVAAQSPAPAVSPVAGNVQLVNSSTGARPERQGNWDGAFNGNVVDPNGAVVMGVQVTLVDEQTKLEMATTTDDNGEFRFQSLSPGSYSLRTESVAGLAAFEMRDIKLPAAEGDNVVTLAIAPVGEYVTVGDVMLVEPSDALVSAVFNADLPAARELIASGVDVNVVDKAVGITALMQAVNFCNQEMVELLLAAGADVNARGESGETALMMLSNETTTETIWTLISAGAKVNRSDSEGMTPLMSAVGVNNEPAIHALVEAGAKINARDHDGKTALIRAAEYGRIECLKALLSEGADVNRKTKDGETALSSARANEHPEAVKLLEDYGAR